MPEHNNRVTLRLSRPSGASQDLMTLTVTDPVSLQQILEVALTDEQFTDLMSNRLAAEPDGTGIPAWILPRPARDRIGMVRVHITRTVSNWPPHGSHEGWRHHVERWAENVGDNLDVDAVRVHATRDGLTVALVKWMPQHGNHTEDYHANTTRCRNCGGAARNDTSDYPDVCVAWPNCTPQHGDYIEDYRANTTRALTMTRGPEDTWHAKAQA